MQVSRDPTSGVAWADLSSLQRPGSCVLVQPPPVAVPLPLLSLANVEFQFMGDPVDFSRPAIGVWGPTGGPVTVRHSVHMSPKDACRSCISRLKGHCLPSLHLHCVQIGEGLGYPSSGQLPSSFIRDCSLRAFAGRGISLTNTLGFPLTGNILFGSQGAG